MRIVVISICDAVGRHLVGEVVRRWPDTVVLEPYWPDTDGSRARRHLSRALRAPVSSCRSAYRHRRDRRRERRVRSALPRPVPKRALPLERLPARDLDTPEGIARLVALRPDVLVLCGCPILAAGVIAVPAIGTINVHLGIAPEYRGEHTIFHALRRQDYDHVGLTIHRVDEGVDTGPLLVQATPELGPDDTEVSVLAKCALLGAGLLVEQLQVVERTGRITGSPQPGTGTLYRKADRQVLRHDLLAALGRHVLHRRPPYRPARVTRYERDVSEPADADRLDRPTAEGPLPG